MNDTAPNHFVTRFGDVERDLPGRGAPWLQALRREAIEEVQSTGFPGPRDEAWKYTRTTQIEKRDFQAPPATADETAIDDAVARLRLGAGGPCLVFVNGRLDSGRSNPGSLPDGAEVLGLARIMEDAPERLEDVLSRVASPSVHVFNAINTAYMRDGAFIHLASDVAVDSPIELLFVSTESEEAFAAHPRIIIVGGEGSSAAVVERYAAIGKGAYFNNVTTEVRLDARARLDHYKLQEESDAAYHVALLQAELGPASRFRSYSFSLGGRLVRNDINVSMRHEGASCGLDGLYLCSGRQHVDYHTRVDHHVPNCRSDEYYKGVLDGRGRGVFDGRVYVHPDAQKTEAHQSNRNLLLSADAEIDTKPQLEIYADDVKCSHGATVGQLDPQMLFYLRSRGLSPDVARGLLTYGFARDVVERLPSPALTEVIGNAVLGRLPDADRLMEMLA